MLSTPSNSSPAASGAQNIDSGESTVRESCLRAGRGGRRLEQIGRQMSRGQAGQADADRTLSRA